MDTYNIYDIIFDDEYHFIYCDMNDNDKSKSTIKTCKMLYPFLRKYKKKITISFIAQIRSFNDLNQPKKFIRENGYTIPELRNKLLIKELTYIDLYVKQFMIEYGINKVRGGSYLKEYDDVYVKSNSIQNEITFPVRYLKSNEILQETFEVIKEMDAKFILRKDKIDFIEKKLSLYTTNENKVNRYSFIKKAGEENIMLLESNIDNLKDKFENIKANMEYINLFMLNNNDSIESNNELIKKRETILYLTQYLSFVSQEGMKEICSIYYEFYYNTLNHLSDAQFQIDIESVYLKEVIDMLLFYYSEDEN